MSVQFAELRKLNGYHFSLEKYQKSLSNLTIRATSLEEPHRSVYLQFVEVGYIRMPINWKGDFELGSDSQCQDIADKAGLPTGGLSSTTLLYSAQQGDVLILGSLMLIEESNSK